MKNSASFAFVILILIVLGCSCPKSEESSKPSNTKAPAAEKSGTSSEKTENPAEPSTTDTTTIKKTDSPSSSSDGRVTLEKYNRINYGMTYLEVVDIIGFDGKIIKTSPDGTIRYMWGDDLRFIMITFMDDKVEIMSQNGLD